MGMFDQLKQLKQMRDQAVVLQRELAKEKVELEEGNVKVVVTGDQKIVSLEIDGQDQSKTAGVINKALKKAQAAAAQKLAGMSGGLSGLLK